MGEEEEREGSFLKPIYTHGCKNALNACYQITRNLLSYIEVNHLSVRIVSFDHIVGWPLLAGVSTVPDKVIQWRSVND